MNLRLTADNLFKVITGVVAAAALFILLLTGTTLLNGALPVIEKFGLYFFLGQSGTPYLVGTSSAPSPISREPS